MHRISRAAVSAAVALVATSTGVGVAEAADAPQVYVTTEGTGAVTPIDSATRAMGAPIGVGAGLGDIVVTPDGATAFVLNYRSGELVPINLVTRAKGAPIAVPGAASLAMAPNGKTVWVVGYGGLVPIATGTRTKGTAIPIAASRIALTPNGARAYVISGGNVVPVNLSTRAIGRSIAMADTPLSLAMAPNGATLYVGTDRGASCVTAACGGVATLTPISTATNTTRRAIPIGRAPYSVAIAPDGTTAFAVSDTLESDTVTPVTLATGVAKAPIRVGTFPYGIAITPNGRTGFVVHDDQADCGCSGLLTSFDTVTGAAGAPVRINKDSTAASYGIAITPAQAPIAGFTVKAARRGTASTFDASTSRATYGSIARYVWTYGDGSSVTTASPRTSHVYRNAGRFTASLRVVDSTGTSTAVVYTGQSVSRNGAARAATTRTLTVS